MKKFFVTVFASFICCFLFIISCNAEDFFIAGKVTSLDKNVAGIEVNVDDQLYETDNNGYYKAGPFRPYSSHTIKLERPDFYFSPDFVEITDLDESKNDCNFVIFGEINGQVTYNGRPMKNAIIKIDDRQQEYITDDKGRYRILNVGINHAYNVSVSSRGYSAEPKKITLYSIDPGTETNSETAALKNTAKNEEDLSEESTNVVNFKMEILKCDVKVTAKQGSLPLSDVEITVNNDPKMKYKTDSNGTCSIKGLIYDRKYIFKAEKKGLVFDKRYQIIERITKDMSLNFNAFVDVSGNVSIDSEPFSGIMVECGDKRVKTDKNGNYIFKNVEPNKEYKIKVLSSIFDFTPKEFFIKSLKNSISDKNFSTRTTTEDLSKRSEEYKKIFQQEKKLKLNAQKKESTKIEKEEALEIKAEEAELLVIKKEEDAEIKEILMQEQVRLKEQELKEQEESDKYRAILETENSAQTEAEQDIQKENNKNINEQQSAEEQNGSEAKDEEKLVSIQGRVVKNKEGVEGVKIMLIMSTETKKFTTDKNGFYKISDLEKDKNYVITVLSDSKTANLSPKSRIYKSLNKSIKNQNFYYIVDDSKEK